MMERPESVTISTITLTEYQKYALVNTVIDGGMILKTIKGRVQNTIYIIIVLPGLDRFRIIFWQSEFDWI